MIDSYKKSGYFESTVVGTVIALLSTTIGALLSLVGAWIASGILLSVTFITWALIHSELALLSTIVIYSLIPFGTLPFKFILTPTFLDITIATVYLVFFLQRLKRDRRPLISTPAHIPIIIFIMLSVLSFVLGSSNTLIGPNLLRKFVGYILNISMALIIVDQVHNRYILKRIIRIILLSGFAAAILGIGLYFAPRNLSELILNYLSVFNYPSGNVLRYIEDNPANPLRAIGTSVDPNIFGGLLAIVAALLVPQTTSSKPIFKQKFASMLMLVVINHNNQKRYLKVTNLK